MTESEQPRLYAGWLPERWQTPVSDARSLRLVSLVDDGALQLTLEDAHDPNRPRWLFTFHRVPAYLNLLEEYRLELWGMGVTTANLGWTVRLPNSPWLDLLRRAESLLDVHHPDLVHYQIGTEDDVIDVLSSSLPEVVALGPAPVDSPVAGKSTTLYWPQDREQIEDTFREIVADTPESASRDPDA